MNCVLQSAIIELNAIKASFHMNESQAVVGNRSYTATRDDHAAQKRKEHFGEDRHIRIRGWWLKYHLDTGEVKFVWVGTREQQASCR